MKKKNNKIFLIILLIIIIALIAGYFLYQQNSVSFKQAKSVACTQDAKVCPDGSSVGRVPPNCEFAPCPDFTAGWKTYTNNQYGFELKYPADFFDPQQQPKLLVGDCNYNVFPNKCPNINDIVITDQISDGGDAGAVKNNLANSGYWDNPDGVKQTINNTTYCLYTTGDAATGHAFNYYYFATVKNKKCLVVYLATSTENCDFYLPLEEGNIERAKNYNNCIATNKVQPTILNEVISTFKFN
jgi:hypothetical protein